MPIGLGGTERTDILRSGWGLSWNLVSEVNLNDLRMCLEGGKG